MLKKSRVIGAVSIALAAILSLSACATVSVKAAVINDTDAFFAMQEVITAEGFSTYLQNQSGVETPAPPVIENETPDLRGEWVSDNPAQILRIGDSRLTIHEISGGNEILGFEGSFQNPTRPVTNYVFDSKYNPEEPAGSLKLTDIRFTYKDDLIFYEILDNLGKAVSVTFSRVSSDTGVVDEPEEVHTIIPTDPEELCNLFTSAVKEAHKDLGGLEPTIECTSEDYVVTYEIPVTYSIGGIETVNGEKITKKEKLALPFSFQTDAVYGDVVFSHALIGLGSGDFATTKDWFDVITDYRVEISFPGEITEPGSGIAEGNIVFWDFETVKSSVDSGKYVLKAAGRADATVDGVPVLAGFGALIVSLILLVLLSRKFFSSRAAAITSFFISPLAPFALALAFVAKKKAGNQVVDTRRANRAIVLSAIFLVFEVIALALFLLMAPDLVTGVLDSWGLVSSGS